MKKIRPIAIIIIFGILLSTQCQDPYKTNTKPSPELLAEYSQQTEFTDPGEYEYLYDELPGSTEEICDLIKKQLIHPLEAMHEYKIWPDDKVPDDGVYPTVSDVLAGLMERDSMGLFMKRNVQDRLVIACYHHALLLASILRYKNIPVRLRCGFARYFEKKAKVRFAHVICEVWDDKDQKWINVDPDRNYIDFPGKWFEPAAMAFLEYKDWDKRNIRYASSAGEGMQGIIHALLLDRAFVTGDERGYWHTPEFVFGDNLNIDDLKPGQIKALHQVARSLTDPEANIEELQLIYEENPFIHGHKRTILDYYERTFEK